MLLATKRRPRRETGNISPRPDGRTLAARRYRRLLTDFEAEIGGELTAIDKALLGQAAALVVRSEQIQAAIVAGETAATDEAVRLASESRRILITLKAKAAKNRPTVVPSVDELFAVNDQASSG